MAAGDGFRGARLQSIAAALAAPLVAAAAHLFFLRSGYRLGRGVEALRETYRRERLSDGAVILCPNHLTHADPYLVGWALGWFRFDPGEWWRRPWVIAAEDNLRRLFPGPLRALAWLLKCRGIPRSRGPASNGRVLRGLAQLLERGDAILIFPEGRRTTTGRVELEARTYGVGRMLASVPGSRALCIYLRGEAQDGRAARPAPGQRFHVGHRVFAPGRTRGGLRVTLQLNRRVLEELAELERVHFADLGRWESAGTARSRSL